MDLQPILNSAAEAAADELAPDRLAQFLTRYAERIEARRTEIVETAHQETSLPKSPRLNDVELPRTTGQLRQAAAAALEGSWALPTIDTTPNIRSRFAAIGPVFVLGPNNFPLAFNAVSGGDFAAAIAAGNPVIARVHPGHPRTTRMLAEEAAAAIAEAGLPAAMLQLIDGISNAEGLRLVADPRIGATAFTGSRAGGLALKSAADAAGKPIYLEMSSLNPVVILPGALRQRLAKIADEFADSCLAASGQFCTNPGLVVLFESSDAERFVAEVKQRFEARPKGVYLSDGVALGLAANIGVLKDAGAQVVTGGAPPANTLLRVDGRTFHAASRSLQTEAFGNASLLVIVGDAGQAGRVLSELEGNLTGCFYSGDGDEALYTKLAPVLRKKVGRLLNDKMPTGVAVSPAMNHGGPYPATGHPGFTSVGIPASLRRFARLECYDNVRTIRLPDSLGDKNPNGKMWRLIDGAWTRGDVIVQH
jgi:2,5-dioxopentanoate dehydrogenase